MSPAVEAWMKRLSRKGPFYLYDTSPYDYVIKRNDGSIYERHGTRYHLIWNDGGKAKIGSLHDHMTCRYGIATAAVLNGDRPHDLWNGAGVTDEEFALMLAVRRRESDLPTFDLSTLVGLTH